MRIYIVYKTNKLLKKITPLKRKGIEIKLPEKLKLSPETVGLIVGEGYIGKRTFIFANSNPKAIDLILEFIKQFNIQIKTYLEVSTKNMPPSFLKSSKKFWENCLNMKIKRVRERKEFNNITEHGTLHLIVNSKIISDVLIQITKDSKKKMETNKKLATSYLKGIIAAEGNINIKKTTKCVYMIRISATKQEERDHYKRCLSSAGINIHCKDMLSVSKDEAKQKGWKTHKGRAGCVIISKWDNFVKVLELGLLELNETKKKKFLKYFKNNKFTRQFLDFKYFIKKEFTMKEAQKYFKFHGRHVDRVLTLFKQGYISRRKINQRDFVYRLSNKYFQLYNLLKKEGLAN